MKSHITEARHPDYIKEFGYWPKWRTIVDGGDSFVNAFLQKQVDEDAATYLRRRELTPAAVFAKAALYEIITSVLTRLPDVVRTGGPSSYISACLGQKGGVDGFGATMNQFMALTVLQELLAMRRVGIFIDRPQLPLGATIEDAKRRPPYIYSYGIEDILAWTLEQGSLTPTEVLLRQHIPVTVENSSLVTGYTEQYQHIVNTGQGIAITTYDSNKNQLNSAILDLPDVPFLILEINNSVLKDIAGHQIALLNLESSTIAFAIAASLAVYVEQADMATFMAALRRSGPSGSVDEDGYPDEDTDVPGTDGATHAVRLGLNRGRRYMKDGDKPGFISPNNENILRSEAVVQTLKDDIRRLMLLTVSNLSSRGVASATALSLSQSTSNNGLAALGASLELAERIISKVWATYEGTEPAVIQYPTDYQIMSDAERRAAIDELTKIRDSAPSKTFQQKVTELISTLLLSNRVSRKVMDKIILEIQSAPALMSKIPDVTAVVEAGIMPREYAAACLCLPEDAAAKGNAEHAERLKRIAASQGTASGTARGNTDGTDDAAAEKEASQDPDATESGAKGVRS